MTVSPLFALTLTHPWAAAIAHLGKRVENRTWQPQGNRGHVGMLLAIHGGKHPGNLAGKSKSVREFKGDLAWIAAHWKPLLEEGLHAGHLTREDVEARGFTQMVGGKRYTNPEAFITTGVVAVARVSAVVENAPSLWAAEGQYHWLLTDVRAIEPIPCPGSQKLWPLPADIAELARTRYQQAGGKL